MAWCSVEELGQLYLYQYRSQLLIFNEGFQIAQNHETSRQSGLQLDLTLLRLSLSY